VRGGITTSKMASLARRTLRSIAKKQNLTQNSPQVKFERLAKTAQKTWTSTSTSTRTKHCRRK
jgi:hypothetical protein